MDNARRFPYSRLRGAFGNVLLRPLLPVIIFNDERTMTVTGLVDTGADINVLPYTVGLELGAVWQSQPKVASISGNLAQYEARGIVLEVSIADFLPVALASGWVRAHNAPLILGQVNFFTEFDVCFFQSQNVFEVRLRSI